MSTQPKAPTGSYGRVDQHEAADELALHVEELALLGYTVLRNLYDAEEVAQWRRRVDDVYGAQESQFGRERLQAIGDADVARAPLLHDFEFARMAAHPMLMELMQRVLGDWFILNVQNAVINPPAAGHHQAAWHRDLPYQNFVITRPLAISALVTLDDFSDATGGTQVLAFTHKSEVLPSERYIAANRITANAPAGSAIVFDAMLFHRAGSNSSQAIRRGVNHVYSTPIMKQNYDFPRALGARTDLDPTLQRLLGYTSQVPVDHHTWRDERAVRLGVR
jgi:ectoine hydroxylase-related dioxygenase (phytanoyl-CoA dioxygenase family)